VNAVATTAVAHRFPRLQRRALLGLIAGLIGVILVVGALFVYYLMTRAPVTSLPGIQQAAQALPPRHLFDFAGAASPVGIAVTPDGEQIFVAEGGGQRLLKVFNRDGRPVGQLSAPGSTPGTRNPAHLALDSLGRLFAVDRARAAVDIYSASLEWEATWQPRALEALGGWLPNGIAFGPDDRVYITEVGRQEHSVLVLDRDSGTLLQVLSRNSGIEGGLDFPVQASADQDGRVYVSDGNAGRVLAISPSGVSTVGGSGDAAIGLPRGLTVSGQKLFVADASTQRILVFATADQPTFLHAFGDEDSDEGLAYPNAVAVDRTGRVYVADRGNHRVQVWSY
jgi:DNA-binding beta-propeller fold protein YncE